ncbi:MAG: dienelactone hydrolase family protein [Burkholderiales bacterium]|nr:dienelactone hydrolase family protein [Burkholderiales bacterium]MCW5576847.1 dienelactone hydrolase family protein [Burkholderiales bacterium]
MALIEQHVTVTTKHGRCPAFAACPDAPGRFPGIIFYMDAPGFREELCNMARRIAKHGYFCLLPDLYYRLGTCRFDLPRRNDAMSAVIRAAMNSLTNADVTDDTAAFIHWLDAQDKAAEGAVGCVGHCMSGRYVTTVAARFSRMKAAASLYGVGIVTDKEDSPHKLLGDVQGELYYAFAEKDASVPAQEVTELAAALKKAGTKHALETLPGTQHGFCFAERAVYHPAASEHAWTKIFDLWDRNLK